MDKKVGRNDVCYCGSGKKYKKCCYKNNVYAVNDNNLAKITLFGLEEYSASELDVFDRFFLETSVGEKFEVRKSFDRYIIKDVSTPIIEMPARSYTSVELNDLQVHILKKDNPRYEQKDVGRSIYYDGIVKGKHFFWGMDGNNTCLKGKISNLFVKQKFVDVMFNIFLFPPQRKYRRIAELIGKDFIINTETSQYNFKADNTQFRFEDSKVIAIMSLVDTSNLETLIRLNQIEYNVSLELISGNPFVILKEENSTLKFTLINEDIVDIL